MNLSNLPTYISMYSMGSLLLSYQSFPNLPNSISMSSHENISSKERLLWLQRILPGKHSVIPSAVLLSASQTELIDMIHGESRKLLELRRRLERDGENL